MTVGAHTVLAKEIPFIVLYCVVKVRRIWAGHVRCTSKLSFRGSAILDLSMGLFMKLYDCVLIQCWQKIFPCLYCVVKSRVIWLGHVCITSKLSYRGSAILDLSIGVFMKQYDCVDAHTVLTRNSLSCVVLCGEGQSNMSRPCWQYI